MPFFLFAGSRPDPYQLGEIVNDPSPIWVKPKMGGLWTCRETSQRRSAWLEWCENERFSHCGRCTLWRLILPEEPRLWRVNDYADLTLTIDKWPRQNTINLKYGPDATIDWEAMARVYDGFELTEEGQ